MPEVATPTKEQQQYAAALRHKLAMESIGLVRTALHANRPVFDDLMALERNLHHVDGMVDMKPFRELMHSKSFDLQIRMVRASVRYLQELDALADEALELAAKEKIDA